jgi:PEP-CTERM motif
MAILLAAAAATLLVQPVCSWDRPGLDRYRGTPAAAVAHYRDIPQADRAVLARRIAAGVPDDTVQISRTAITGHYRYESRIADMHFGAARMCRSVTRTKWKAAHRETAAVYCAGDECVLVPQVCGNVSRVRRVVTSGSGSPGTTGGSPGLPADLPARPAAPVPVYTVVPGPGEELPPPLPPEGPAVPLPRLDYPGPGREVGLPVPLAPVPEPATWAMLAGGMVLVAAWVRRRKK